VGLQGIELVGQGVDGDFDGVTDELTVGDLTSLTVYFAAQPRPTTQVELAALRLIPPVASAQAGSIQRETRSFSGSVVRDAICRRSKSDSRFSANLAKTHSIWIIPSHRG